MTADFFGATLTTSSYDLEEKSDHGKEEQIEKAFNGQGQAQRCKEERREKEGPADEGEGQEGRLSAQGCEKGSCSEEGQVPSQSRQEGCAQTEGSFAARGSAKTCSAGFGTDDLATGHAGLRATGIDVGSRHGTLGVLKNRSRQD
jgi:hypothetical protein